MHRYDQPRRLLAYGIAGLAGFIDAAGFLAADRYFVSFMSGNTTRLGVDLALHPASAILPALLILGFVSGVTIGALVVYRHPATPKSAALTISTLLIGIAGLCHALGIVPLFLAASVLSMGAINNAFRRKEDEGTVGVTYMTGALVRCGQAIAACIAGRQSKGGFMNLLLWACLAGGALAGALATVGAPHIAPWLPLAAAVLLLAYARRVERRSRGEPAG